ncbi:MAG: metallophosphoesterase [Oscillospiraceae bacterium]|jgi:predicted MPP superfamily phosphohydrolase|nr:metallophosphoesterase [Oscillospiraceae bacterium]
MGKKLLAAGLAVLLIGACLFYWQNYSIRTERVSLHFAKLPTEFDGLRVVEIADLHGREFGKDSKRLLREVRACKPDIICIDGDLFDENTELSMLVPLLRGLLEIAPTYYVTGNHEWRVERLQNLLTWMRAQGVQVLDNTYCTLRRGDSEIVVAGVHDPYGPYDMKTPQELVSEIRAAYGEEIYILMLAHRNDTLEQWAALGVDLVLTGHCHGGVVRLPLLGGIFGTKRELLPDYDAGAYTQGQTTLFVSRGLGYSNVHLRLGNRPHLPLLILRSGGKA